METRIDDVEERLDNVEFRLDDLEESVKAEPDEDAPDVETRMASLEGKFVVLETLIEQVRLAMDGRGPTKTRKTRAKREYSDEERKAIRERLVAGKKAAQERREREAKNKARREARAAKKAQAVTEE